MIAFSRLIVERAFQPTLPAREATERVWPFDAVVLDVSTHASREGSDCDCGAAPGPHWEFQPTLPAREATAGWDVIVFVPSLVSTHASREGSDQFLMPFWSVLIAFQPTLPAREATDGVHYRLSFDGVSTHASREGSDMELERIYLHDQLVSTHASREGSDIQAKELKDYLQRFNPRFPRGKRQGYINLTVHL